MAKKNTEEDDFKQKLQVYKLELKLVYEKSQESFEKQLSYISAGALGFSILYIENVVKDVNKCQFKPLLIICWILLTLTLVVNLFSHYYSSTSNYKSIKEIDEDKYDSNKIDGRIKNVNLINVGTLVSFVLGILLLIIFIISNTMSKEIKTPSPDLQKGRTPTSPPVHPRPQTGQNPTAPPKGPTTQPSKPSK